MGEGYLEIPIYFIFWGGFRERKLRSGQISLRHNEAPWVAFSVDLVFSFLVLWVPHNTPGKELSSGV